MTTDSSPERPSDVGPAGQAGIFQPEPAAAVPPPPAAQPAEASAPQPAAGAPVPAPPADPLETLSEATGLPLEDEGGVKHLQTPEGAKDGAVKCARCGATEVSRITSYNVCYTKLLRRYFPILPRKIKIWS